MYGLEYADIRWGSSEWGYQTTVWWSKSVIFIVYSWLYVWKL